MMLSLLRPDKGTIRIFGKLLQDERRGILRNTGAFVEKPDFYEYLSAYKNLDILSRYSGIRADHRRIMEVLGLLGLDARAHSRVRTYSKGMKQRLGIAQSLLHDPVLLILDEPASGLDPAGSRDVRDLIKYLNEEQGKTIMLSSHNLSEVEMVAERVLIINEGKKIVEGEVREMISQQSRMTRFSCDDPVRAAGLLRESRFKGGPYDVKDGGLYLKCSRDDIPEINEFLVNHGVRIESIRMEQSLEEYFLNMT
jgi:ABC-2 type transport system ATP-binding protein